MGAPREELSRQPADNKTKNNATAATMGDKSIEQRGARS
jgi:hypothetical protein